jgi:acyl transferase domain-containing protein
LIIEKASEMSNVVVSPPTNGEVKVHVNGVSHARSPITQSGNKFVPNGVYVAENAALRLFVLSAHDKAAVQSAAQELVSYISKYGKDPPSNFLDDLAYTLAEHRTRFPFRLAAPASSILSLTEALQAETTAPFDSTGKNPKVCFVFTGQGAQWPTMGKELISIYDVFRQAIERARDVFRDLGASWSLIGKLWWICTWI